MVTFFITSVLVLAVIAIAIYFWQKPAETSQTIELPAPPQPQSLFPDFRVNQLRPSTLDQPREDAAKVDQETFAHAIDAIRAFQQSPNKHTTTELLHVAALSDNPKNYERAIELVLLSWRDRSLADISARDLQELLNSEYWVLSSHARTSGAGFVLKRTLATANSELEHTPNN